MDTISLSARYEFIVYTVNTASAGRGLAREPEPKMEERVGRLVMAHTGPYGHSFYVEPADPKAKVHRVLLDELRAATDDERAVWLAERGER